MSVATKQEPVKTYRQKRIQNYLDKYFPLKTQDCEAVRDARAFTEEKMKRHRAMMREGDRQQRN